MELVLLELNKGNTSSYENVTWGVDFKYFFLKIFIARYVQKDFTK